MYEVCNLQLNSNLGVWPAPNKKLFNVNGWENVHVFSFYQKKSLQP